MHNPGPKAFIVCLVQTSQRCCERMLADLGRIVGADKVSMDGISRAIVRNKYDRPLTKMQ